MISYAWKRGQLLIRHIFFYSRWNGGYGICIYSMRPFFSLFNILIWFMYFIWKIYYSHWQCILNLSHDKMINYYYKTIIQTSVYMYSCYKIYYSHFYRMYEIFAFCHSKDHFQLQRWNSICYGLEFYFARKKTVAFSVSPVCASKKFPQSNFAAFRRISRAT